MPEPKQIETDRTTLMSDPIPGAETLLEAYELITGDRQAAYDHPSEDYAKVVQIFEALTGIRLTLEQALLFMVAIKFARLRTNLSRDRLHHDSLVDAMGYLGCLAMVRARRDELEASLTEWISDRSARGSDS